MAILVKPPERTDTIDTGTESPLDIADSLKKRLISLANIIFLLNNQQMYVCVYHMYILYCFSTSPNWAQVGPISHNRLGTWTKLMLYDSVIIIRLVDSNLNIFIVGLIEYIYSNFGQPCCYTGECVILYYGAISELYVWYKLDRVHCWGLLEPDNHWKGLRDLLMKPYYYYVVKPL